MKKFLILWTTLFFVGFILTACGNDDPPENNTSAEEDTAEELANKTETEASDENESEEAGENNESESTEEEPSDLGVGDTGVFETPLGDFELTVDSAEIVGEELDGEASILDELMVLDLTFTNIGDSVLDAEDLILIFEVTEMLEGSGYSNGAEDFDSIEVFEGEIQPGEERTAQFIADINLADEYYFRMNPGSAAAGSIDEIIWTISDEEAR